MRRRTRRELLRDYLWYVLIALAVVAYAVVLGAFNLRTGRDVTPFIGVPFGIILIFYFLNPRFRMIRSSKRKAAFIAATALAQAAFCVIVCSYSAKPGQVFVAALMVELMAVQFVLDKLENRHSHRTRLPRV